MKEAPTLPTTEELEALGKVHPLLPYHVFHAAASARERFYATELAAIKDRARITWIRFFSALAFIGLSLVAAIHKEELLAIIAVLLYAVVGGPLIARGVRDFIDLKKEKYHV
jgi:hypothetical protein